MRSSHIFMFRTLCEELSSFIELEGLVVRPYGQESLPYFQRMTPCQQDEAIQNLQSYIRICKSVYEEGGVLRDSSLFLRKALSFYGYYCDLRALEGLKNDELAEFYTSEHKPLFRNLCYFENASYTLEDIYSRPWIHLYDRDPKIGEVLVKYLDRFFAGAHEVIYVDLPEHLLTERVSLEKLKSKVKIRAIVPLQKEGKNDAYLVLAGCQPQHPWEGAGQSLNKL
ncbi:MAG: hypothetical protein HUU57_07950 [Bdellovibrio sp.]|nr:hypothetical protein [Bdellovibrio sp.]